MIGIALDGAWNQSESGEREIGEMLKCFFRIEIRRKMFASQTRWKIKRPYTIYFMAPAAPGWFNCRRYDTKSHFPIPFVLISVPRFLFLNEKKGTHPPPPAIITTTTTQISNHGRLTYTTLYNRDALRAQGSIYTIHPLRPEFYFWTKKKHRKWRRLDELLKESFAYFRVSFSFGFKFITSNGTLFRL